MRKAHDGSPPLASYTTSKAIRARLTVLYDKSWRIKSYNHTLDPQTLDGKQRAIMADYARKLGRDRMPKEVCDSLRWTITTLENRLIELGSEKEAA